MLHGGVCGALPGRRKLLLRVVYGPCWADADADGTRTRAPTSTRPATSSCATADCSTRRATCAGGPTERAAQGVGRRPELLPDVRSDRRGGGPVAPSDRQRAAVVRSRMPGHDDGGACHVTDETVDEPWWTIRRVTGAEAMPVRRARETTGIRRLTAQPRWGTGRRRASGRTGPGPGASTSPALPWPPIPRRACSTHVAFALCREVGDPWDDRHMPRPRADDAPTIHLATCWRSHGGSTTASAHPLPLASPSHNLRLVRGGRPDGR